jgi:hypothetical protein
MLLMEFGKIPVDDYSCFGEIARSVRLPKGPDPYEKERPLLGIRSTLVNA